MMAATGTAPDHTAAPRDLRDGTSWSFMDRAGVEYRFTLRRRGSLFWSVDARIQYPAAADGPLAGVLPLEMGWELPATGMTARGAVRQALRWAGARP